MRCFRLPNRLFQTNHNLNGPKKKLKLLLLLLYTNQWWAISRRNVEVILPDGKSSYRTDKHRAFSIVKNGRGFWVNEAHTGVQMLSDPEAALVQPREWTKANWCPIPSPAYPPGPLVLQVVT